MGIQLSVFDKVGIKMAAELKESGASIYPYLFGALNSAVDLFVAGHSQQRDLESIWTSVKLIEQLWKTCSAEELSEIYCGTRELPGQDVQDGQ
jgi:hypothetical protein